MRLRIINCVRELLVAFESYSVSCVRELLVAFQVDQLCILARIPDCAFLDVRILSPKRNLDHRSFFSFGQYVNEFIQIISFSEQISFKVR